MSVMCASYPSTMYKRKRSLEEVQTALGKYKIYDDYNFMMIQHFVLLSTGAWTIGYRPLAGFRVISVKLRNTSYKSVYWPPSWNTGKM